MNSTWIRHVNVTWMRCSVISRELFPLTFDWRGISYTLVMTIQLNLLKVSFTKESALFDAEWLINERAYYTYLWLKRL